ncbi:hypothetical protein EDD85DRAFT_784126 [Armillaria nabsnona]|nr:hypothetical protein EDD85DRAFT_784126 [Armillaria nabsnona]
MALSIRTAVWQATSKVQRSTPCGEQYLSDNRRPASEVTPSTKFVQTRDDFRTKFPRLTPCGAQYLVVGGLVPSYFLQLLFNENMMFKIRWWAGGGSFCRHGTWDAKWVKSTPYGKQYLRFKIPQCQLRREGQSGLTKNVKIEAESPKVGAMRRVHTWAKRTLLIDSSETTGTWIWRLQQICPKNKWILSIGGCEGEIGF